jgi:hypothetical protein
MAKPILHVPDYPRTSFRPRHWPVITSITEAFFAAGEPLDPVRLQRFVIDVDGAISTASKTLRFGLLAMLDVIEWTPLFILGKPRAFTALSLEDRARYLTRLERSKLVPLALIFVAWKTLLTMLYFEDELELLGYPGPARTRYLSVVSAPSRDHE